MNEDLTSLLNIISKINEKYEEIYKISGEKFNIFDILRVANTEKYHSRILATLLDPEGSHNKGSLFLEKFLEIVATKYETCAKTNEDSKDVVGKKFSIEGVIVQEEKPIDNGRPDITITNKNGEKIILENKIWDEERDRQLERYSEEKPIHLIYLTPFGIKAEKIGEGDFNYIKMSYKKDIQEWLELCKRESVDNPILRETLTQYILSTRKLTGQTRSVNMEKEVIDAIVKDSKYVSAAFDIAGSIEAMKKYIMDKFLVQLKEIAKDIGFDEELEINLHGRKDGYFKGQETEFWLYKKEWEYLAICLYFKGNKRGFSYGLHSKEYNENENGNRIHPKLKDTGLSLNQKIKDKAKKEAEAKESSYKCYNDDEEYPLLSCKDTKSLWEEWKDEKDFFTLVISEDGIEKMKTEFRNVIKELSEIGDRLEDKLKEM